MSSSSASPPPPPAEHDKEAAVREASPVVQEKLPRADGAGHHSAPGDDGPRADIRRGCVSARRAPSSAPSLLLLLRLSGLNWVECGELRDVEGRDARVGDVPDYVQRCADDGYGVLACAFPPASASAFFAVL